MKNILKDHRGMTALLMIIVVGSATLILGLSITFLGLGGLEQGYTSQKGGEAFALADACVEEALQQLFVDNNYVGGDLNIFDGSCIITIAGGAINKTLTVEANKDEYINTQQLEVELIDGSISITSWQEI